LALRFGNHLRIDVQCGRDAEVPHLGLHGLGISAGLHQPGGVAGP